MWGAADKIRNYLHEPATESYFRENNVRITEFRQYYKGCSELGSLVESCVKLCKRLIAGSIGKSVLNFRDFEFVIMQTKHMVNKRPIVFQHSLRDCKSNEIPETITPELLLFGHKFLSVNMIPHLHRDSEDPDPAWERDPVEIVKDVHAKLKTVRSKLEEIYCNEFLVKLMEQAVDKRDRYKKVSHHPIAVGDLILLKESNTKPINYPLGRVASVQVNSLGEVTGATVKKGKTGEIVKRHSSAIVPLLRMSECVPTDDGADSPCNEEEDDLVTNIPVSPSQVEKPRLRREAALHSEEKTRSML